MPPKKKKKGELAAVGLSGTVLGAADPSKEAPNFAAMVAVIFCGLVTILAVAVSINTKHWFVSNTGAHAGLFVMVEKNWECGDTCPSKERDQEGGWAQGGMIMFGGGIFVCILSMVSI